MDAGTYKYWESNKAYWKKGDPSIRMQEHTFKQCKEFPEKQQRLPPAEYVRYKSRVYKSEDARKYNVRVYATRFLKAMNGFGIVYKVVSGTLLGAYRHGGLIPGDKDVDIEIPLRLNKQFLRHQIEWAAHISDQNFQQHSGDQEHQDTLNSDSEIKLGSLKNNCTDLYGGEDGLGGKSILKMGLLCDMDSYVWSALLESTFKVYLATMGFGINRKDSNRRSAHYYIREPCRARENTHIRLDRSCWNTDIRLIVDEGIEGAGKDVQNSDSNSNIIGSNKTNTKHNHTNPKHRESHEADKRTLRHRVQLKRQDESRLPQLVFLVENS
eukprot:CFRG3524T1